LQRLSLLSADIAEPLAHLSGVVGRHLLVHGLYLFSVPAHPTSLTHLA
jgi:hypothetical protein